MKKIITFFLFILTFWYCSKPVPTDELVKARESIQIAGSYQPEEVAKDHLDNAVASLKEAHENLPSENYEKTRELAQKSYSFSQLSIYQTLPRKLETTSKSYEELIQKAYEANAEILAEMDYKSAKNLSEEAKSREQALSNQKLTEEEIKKISAYQFNSQQEKETLVKKVEDSNLKTIEVLDLYNQAQKAAKTAYETSMNQKSEYENQLESLARKWNQAKEYGIEKLEPEASIMIEGKIKEISSEISNNQLRLAHIHLKDLEDEILKLYAVAERKYAEDLLTSANSDFQITKSKVNDSKNVVNQSQKKDKIYENLNAAEESIKQSREFFNNGNYSDSIHSSREAINLTKIVSELLSEAIVLRNREIALEREKLTREEIKKKQELQQQEVQTETKPSESGKIKLIYTVKKTKPAESLWRISGKKEIYNNPRKWPKIYDANKDQIKNPNLIYPGQKLKILED